MTEIPGWTLFPTPIGGCAIAWREATVIGVQLPERDDHATRARMRRRWPGACESAPPEAVRAVIGALTDLLEGKAADLSALPLPFEQVPAFNRQVYEIARGIPAGQTLSYGEVAKRLGDVSLARAVGQALGQNPWPLIVPCHRVVGADGRPGGFSGGAGTPTKLRLLAIEGVLPGDQRSLFD
ncbi:MAG TPA: methylated-DNA--[protein]-cysteine S-methyltransferase [Gemmatimonadales bacterium]|nr:methylated-DNA--[protein]-cysteine S-methyltransferase [Gemmatimonadales bacterium]